MKNVLQLSRGESLEPFFCHQKREGVAKSFFSEYGSIAVNLFGDIAFFGKHRALNGGKPTLFLVNRADNRLRMLVRTREADRPTSSIKFGKALNEHMATVSSPAQVNLPKKLTNNFESVFSHSPQIMFWNSENTALIVIAGRYGFRVDIESGLIRTKDYRNEPTDKIPVLQSLFLPSQSPLCSRNPDQIEKKTLSYCDGAGKCIRHAPPPEQSLIMGSA